MERPASVNSLVDVINCASMVMSFFVIVFLGVYLFRETGARGGNWAAIWRHLPPSMSLAVAFLMFVTGAFLRARFFDNYRGVVVGGVLMIVGGLCIIRSATRHAYGHWPWVATSIVVVSVTFGVAWLS
jgi:hypothetical protein